MRQEARFKVADELDTEIRKAAWDKAGKRANGALEEATFFWPPDVRRELVAITLVTQRIRSKRCRCKGKKDKPCCERIEELAPQELLRLNLPKENARRIVRALARLAHASRIDDRSSD